MHLVEDAMASLLDQLKTQLGGILAAETAGAEGEKSPAHDPHAMLESVVELIGQHGGPGGLLDKLKASGLGNAAATWVATGDNQPVNANQLESALGGDAISKITEKLGVSKEQASSLLAKYLPMVIDRLTPRGKVEEGT
jgi:uncharacterized protein YidB (DUF937 family)